MLALRDRARAIAEGQPIELAAGDAWLVGRVASLEALCTTAQAGAAEREEAARRRAEESAATREKLQATARTRPSWRPVTVPRAAARSSSHLLTHTTNTTHIHALLHAHAALSAPARPHVLISPAHGLLQALPAARIDAACEQSWDGLAELVSEVLGGDAL